MLMALLAPDAVAQKQAPDSTRRVDSAQAVLPEIEVHAADPGLPTPPPVSGIVIDPAVLQTTQASDIYDRARRVSGIEIHEQGQGPGFAANVVVRGFTSDHGSDVLIAVDGVPLNLPVHGHVEGYADWSIVQPYAVRAMRVTDGPASPTYGDFNFGGLVEVSTPTDAKGTSAAMYGSSFGDAGGAIWSGAGNSQRGGFVALDLRRNQGWREHSSYWLGDLALRGRLRVGAGQVQGGLLLYGSTWNSPGWVTVAQYNAGDLTQAADTTDGGNGSRGILYGRYLTSLGEHTTLDATLWGQGVRSNFFLNIPDADGTSQSQERDNRYSGGGQATVGWSPALGAFSFGISGLYNAGDYDLYATVAREWKGDITRVGARYATAGGFARWQRTFSGRTSFDLGARLDAVRYSALDRLDPAGAWRDATYVIASPKLGVRYLAGSKVALLGSFSRGFRGSPGVVKDPALPPMTAWAAEAGVEYSAKHVQAQLAGFHLAVSHEVIQDPVTLEITDQGQSVRQGINVTVTVQASRVFDFEVDGTYNDAFIRGTAAPSTAAVAGEHLRVRPPGDLNHTEPLPAGSDIPGVARYWGRAQVGAALGGGKSIGLAVRVGGPFRPIGEPDILTSPYAVVDLSAAFPITRSGLLLSLQVQNVTNTKFPEIRASGYINPGTPLALRAVFQWSGITL